MSRTLQIISTSLPKEQVEAIISGMLVGNNYAWVDERNEWQRGDGVWVAPQFISYEVRDGAALIEGYIKAGMIPGKGKEKHLKGYYGIIIKNMVVSMMNNLLQEVQRYDPQALQQSWQHVKQSELNRSMRPDAMPAAQQQSADPVQQPPAQQQNGAYVPPAATVPYETTEGTMQQPGADSVALPRETAPPVTEQAAAPAQDFYTAPVASPVAAPPIAEQPRTVQQQPAAPNYNYTNPAPTQPAQQSGYSQQQPVYTAQQQRPSSLDRITAEQANKAASQNRPNRYNGTLISGWLCSGISTIFLYFPIPFVYAWFGLILSIIGMICGSITRKADVVSGKALFIFSLVMMCVFAVLTVILIMAIVVGLTFVDDLLF